MGGKEEQTRLYKWSRRQFLKETAKIGAGVFIAGSLVEFAAACASDAAALAGQGPFDVFIVGGQFIPQKLTIQLDETATWTNKDNKSYTLISDSGLFQQTIPPGGTFSFTFRTHDNHRYHNAVKPRMKGIILVEQNPDANCNDCHG